MTDPKYAAFTALDPFFRIAQQGLAGLVDGDHYFDTIAADAVFEFRYDFPDYPRMVSGRDALMNLYSGYGNIRQYYSPNSSTRYGRLIADISLVWDTGQHAHPSRSNERCSINLAHYWPYDPCW